MSRALPIKTQVRENCLVCDSKGVSLHQSLVDTMFNSEQKWHMLECRKCFSTWLSPRPATSELASLYESEEYYTHTISEYLINMPILGRYHEYLKKGYLAAKFNYGDEVIRRQRFLGVLSSLRFNWSAWEDYKVVHLNANPGAKLLEVGCGNGVVLRNLLSLGWNAKGCDLDGESIKVCRANGLDVDHGSLESLQFATDSFDAVVSTHVIEHVDDPVSFLNECFRIMKQGGQLRIVTPNIQSLGHRLFGHRWYHLDPPRHLFLFSSTSLRKLAEDAGFVEVETSTGLRDDNNSFAASLNYLLDDHDFMKGSKIRGKLVRLISKGLQFIEWLGSPLWKNSRGELILKATK